LLRKLEYEVQCSESTRDSLDQLYAEATASFSDLEQQFSELLQTSDATIGQKLDVIDSIGDGFDREVHKYLESTKSSTDEYISALQSRAGERFSAFEANASRLISENDAKLSSVISNGDAKLTSLISENEAKLTSVFHRASRWLSDVQEQSQEMVTELRERLQARIDDTQATFQGDWNRTFSKLEEALAKREAELVDAQTGRRKIEEFVQTSQRDVNEFASKLSAISGEISQSKSRFMARNEEAFVMIEDHIARIRDARIGLDECLDNARAEETARALEFEIGARSVRDEAVAHLWNLVREGATTQLEPFDPL
jgi:hypothetical protein